MLKRLMTAAVALLLSCGFAHAQTQPPNIVLIFADDMGYGALSCYGQRDYQTPHIDKLAAEGARFTQMYVPTPYCAPSRGTILTGRYPFRHGQMANPAPDAGNNTGMALSEITLAELLKPLGYATACFGKWHLGHVPGHLPTEQGFDEYRGILYSNDMRPVQLVENESVVEYPVVQGYLTRRYTDRAIRFIEAAAAKKQPFFLYLPHAMPHKPLAVSPEFHTPETPDDLYADVMRELDHEVGRLLAKLRELNLDERTLVIFTSDNGPSWGGSTGGLRGMKGRTWEGGTRVPFIARMPRRVKAGQVIDAPAGTINVFPTVAELVGAKLPGDRVIDGRSMWPLLSGKSAGPVNEMIYTMAGNRLATIREGKWKLHVAAPGSSRPPEDAENWVDPRGPDGITIIAQDEQYTPMAYPGLTSGDEPKAMMLFDLEADPTEQHDVADKHPEIVKRLKAKFDETAKEVPRQERQGAGGKRRPGLMILKGGELKYDEEYR